VKIVFLVADMELSPYWLLRISVVAKFSLE
jgi:hypothetical protein